MAAFDSAWLKWAWAMRHIQDFNAENDAWIKSVGSLTEHVSFDAATSELVLSFTGVTQPTALMSLHLADAMGAFRQSLDHAARAMVNRGSKPAENSYFVLRPKKSDFARGMKQQMPGVPAGSPDYKVVEDLHKTHIWGGKNANHTPLIIMRDLNNRDKHNAVTAVASLATKARIGATFSDCDKAGPFYPTTTGPFTDGDELARVPVTVTGPNPTMAPTGTIRATANIDGFDIQELINHVGATIRDLLAQLQPSAPAAVHQLGVAGLKPPAPGTP
jgi:hypothetical protein